MSIIGYFSKMRMKKDLILDLPRKMSDSIIDRKEIEAIINKVPKNFSKIEKAYFVYLELGKIVNESPKYVFVGRDGKMKHYNDAVDSEYYGICKSIAELYVSMLRDKRIGVSADLVKQRANNPLTHIDTILKIDGKNYIVNLINDLSRIKTSRRVDSFCFNVIRKRHRDDPRIEDDKAYLKRLEAYYGKIDVLPRSEIEQLDKKLGYSFSMAKFIREGERGLYTEDIIELIKDDMEDPELFKEYVLHNQEVPKEEILKYKLDYIFENINKFAKYTGNLEYLENIRWYVSVAKAIITPEEVSRIETYAAIVGKDTMKIMSILKVGPYIDENSQNNEKNEGKNFYYVYSNTERKYVGKTAEEMKEFLDGLNEKNDGQVQENEDKEDNNLHIIGNLDRFNPQPIDELDL